METNKKSKFLALIWLAFGAFARLLPHLPNVNPSVSACLFSGAQLNRGLAILSTLAMMLVSDIALSMVHGHEIFGFWSIFTYSGFLAIVLFGRGLAGKFNGGRAVVFTVGASLAFWIWTNFGTWLTSGMYTRDAAGLSQCFLAGVPFLGASLVGDLGWMLVLFLSYQAAGELAAKRGWFSQTSAAA